ncbi:MAG TPA: 2'-5' RNA ligase family protein, partial [Gaiellaceae bacterium]|nr:2'-5' RNA ligase family protein [Gaiellaceae bacterium]
LRLFLALELDADVTTALRLWADSYLSGARPVDSFHVTLAFLGSRPAAELDGIAGALRESVAECAPFTLEPVRYRETRSVGMLVLADPSGEATRLAERVHERLESLGVYERERRPWLPHVTVVRFRERPRLAPPLPETGPFAPSGAAAFLSRLRRTGAHYEALESYPLGQ